MMFNDEGLGQAMQNSYNRDKSEKIELLEKLIDIQGKRIENIEKAIVDLCKALQDAEMARSM